MCFHRINCANGPAPDQVKAIFFFFSAAVMELELELEIMNHQCSSSPGRRCYYFNVTVTDSVTHTSESESGCQGPVTWPRAGQPQCHGLSDQLERTFALAENVLMILSE